MSRPVLASALICAALLALAVGFALKGSGMDFGYVIPRRLMQMAAMVIGGIAVALSSITFQTLAGNRILPPAVMGYEAECLTMQALLVLFFSAGSVMLLGGNGSFLISILAMLAYSLALHLWLFRDGREDVWQLILSGIVLALAVALLWRRLPVLDVLGLGREQAISLGVAHGAELRRLPGLIARLNRPQSGQITLDGQDIAGLSARDFARSVDLRLSVGDLGPLAVSPTARACWMPQITAPSTRRLIFFRAPRCVTR